MYPMSNELNSRLEGEKEENPIENDSKNLSKKYKKRLLANSTVGTPDYIAPEVFSQKGYGPEVDWWSVGVILFETMVISILNQFNFQVGYPPFFSENPSDTCKKIVKWQKYFKIPNEVKISKEAESLIKKLIASADVRLGLSGADEIKNHPFFKGLDWDKLPSMKAPFIPEVYI